MGRRVQILNQNEVGFVKKAGVRRHFAGDLFLEGYSRKGLAGGGNGWGGIWESYRWEAGVKSEGEGSPNRLKRKIREKTLSPTTKVGRRKKG